ncbi:MAG: response regulator, partial [Campylobacteraceae bacterium]|nr:response regulator [Campylobacteraceae bacterium]
TEKSKNKMLSLGAEDYLTKPINAELFENRIKHYLKIIALRNKKIEATTNVLNPFDTKVYSRSITFRIDKEEALIEFWDYWLNGEKNILNLSDCVRLIYGFGLWVLKNNQFFNIIVEESAENFYKPILLFNPINGLKIFY